MFSIPFKHLIFFSSTSICGMVPVYSSTFYSMSKAALDQFTQCASNEFGRRGIRLVLFLPSFAVMKRVSHNISILDSPLLSDNL